MKSAGDYRIVLILFLLFGLQSHAQETNSGKMTKTAVQMPVVIFVCEHGSAKSIVAATHFNDLARKRGMNVRAISRGTNPDLEIAPGVARGLRADGLEVGAEKPTRLSREDASGAIRAVAFCPLPKGYLGSVPIEEWNDVPSTSEDYGKARNNIVERVKHLLDILLTPVARSQTLKKVDTFDLPGPPGKRFDYLTIDYKHDYLLSAHLGAGLLYVIDLKTNKLVKAIPDVPGIEGVEYAPDVNKIYTSNWTENKIGVIPLDQMQVVKKLPTEAKPDGSTYAEPFHKLYVSDERGRAVAIVDVREDKIINTLHFESETGMPQYDPVARKVYVNLQEQNLFAVIDPSTDKVVARYPVGECKGNHGMALDPEHHRAFLQCEGNNMMTVFDLDAHKPIAHLPTAAGGDVVKYDPGLKRIYVACSSGSISVFQEEDANHFRKLEDFPVQRRVHSLAVDVRTHRVYTPEEQEDGRPVARMVVYDAVLKQR